MAEKRKHGIEAAELVADVVFRRRVQRFAALGSRVTGELLAQLAVRHPDTRAEIECFIDRALDLEDAIAQLGADDWPPLPPLQVVS